MNEVKEANYERRPSYS